MKADRFKFRAWGKDERYPKYETKMYMLEVYELRFSQYDPETNMDSIPSALISYKVDKAALRPLSELVLMQSTGLLDKNGKEIFEGDVVEFEKKRGDIFWNEFAARFYVNADFGLDHDIACSRELIIVGNIYENPELIRKDNT
jgi:uncharacterized phage protein (TIGR01671 family)